MLSDGAPPLYLIEFDATRFKSDAFTRASIVCPDSIMRSVPRRQAEFFFGRMAARLALSDLGVPTEVEIGIGATREPLWPDGVIGSITHNVRYAAAAVLRAGLVQGLGIDVEAKIGMRERDAVLTTALDMEEAAMLDALACAQWPHDLLLTAVFSAKESLFKGVFGVVGRYFDFSAARWTGWDRERRRLRLTLMEALSPQFQCGRECSISVAQLDADTIVTYFLW